MTEPNIPHFQPLTVSGQFPESDVRGAAAREAASGRVTYLDWEEQQRLEQEEQQLRNELDALKSEVQVKRQLRRYMRIFDAATAGDRMITDVAEKARRCRQSFDIVGLMIKVCSVTDFVVKEIQNERYAPTPVASPLTEAASIPGSPSRIEQTPLSSHATTYGSSPSPGSRGSPQPAESIHIVSTEPVAEMTKPATSGPIVTRYGRIIRAPKRL
ncbi:hypothetical protein M9X92_005372 [Pyricularia oryzae]|nr:hypothetical protein M9X92_005372 [Pyricularia oryzae]